MDFLQATAQGVLCGGKPILLRGMGLGGWLLPEGYMWKLYTKCDRPRRIEAMIETLCGTEYAQAFWPSYYSGYITQQDIALIAAQGCNSVRLPLNARHLYTLNADGSILLNDAGICYVDNCVQWCKEAGIYVLLDMHAAPGGQTGQNIDDCENDQPELFQNAAYRAQLKQLWVLLAMRYAHEPAVMGYDLLNEPLCNLFSQYNAQLFPMYQELIAAIRAVDPLHMIVLEGAHWSTDFRIFDALSPAEMPSNVLLQFHKYWNEPDRESIAVYQRSAKRLGLPLYAGETGENNLEWYTTAFPMFEREGIGWCFWSYKKMENGNSPISFSQPRGWGKILAWLDGGKQPSCAEAQSIFDGFLRSIRRPRLNRSVFDALLRRAPLTLPCEAYDDSCLSTKRQPGAAFRCEDAASILFCHERQGAVDFNQNGGEPRPESERLAVALCAGESLEYRITLPAREMLCTLRVRGSGLLSVSIGGTDQELPLRTDDFNDFSFPLCGTGHEEILTLKCMQGSLCAEQFRFAEPQPAAYLEQTTGLTRDCVSFCWEQPCTRACASQETDLINLYPEEAFQAFTGFGGAFTESAGYVFAQLPPARQEEVLQACFGEEGLRYTLGRCPIDSCDFSLQPYSAVSEPTDKTLTSFSLSHDEQYIFPFLRRAAALAPGLKLLLSPWSPPAFMKTNHQRNGGGSLLPEYRALWAEYICRYLEAYQKQGFPVFALSVQNEPNAAQLWDSCVYTAEQEKTFLRDALMPALHRHHLDNVAITIWDHNKERLYDRTAQICQDSATQRAVAAVGFHWYSGDHFEALELVRRRFPDKQLFFTEGCIEYAHFSAEAQLKNAQRYAHELIGDLNAGLNAFFDWNLLLDLHGGPNHAGNYCEAPLMADPATGKIRYNLSYFYLRHFAQCFAPGDVRIGVTRFTDHIEAAAMQGPDGHIKVVLLNRTKEPISCILRLKDTFCRVDALGDSITSVVFPC